MDSASSSLRYAIAILMLALSLRLFGIATESIWVDEAFTAESTRGSFREIIELNAKDTHPPAYYLGLSLWRSHILPRELDPTLQLVVLRSYSTAWSLLGIALLMVLARAMAGERVAWIAGLLAAVNPLDIYYATEARMYSQACTLSIAGAIGLWHWCESVRLGRGLSSWWKWAAVFALCGEALLFTHYVGVTLLVAQGLLAVIVFVRARAWMSLLGMLVATVVVAAIFSPWLEYAQSFRGSLVNPASIGWTPTPGFLDYVSFVGREFFWGRANKLHEVWWGPTAIVPAMLIAVATRKCWGRASAEERAAAFYAMGLLVLPLLVCALVGATYREIYYRPRYSIFLLPSFLIALSLACNSLQSRRSTTFAVVSCACLMMLGTIIQERTPQKKAWRDTARSWPQTEAPAFYVVLPAQHQRPLRHYLNGRIRHTPMSVLQRLGPLPAEALIWVANWPEPLDESDAAYRDWLKALGPARRQTLPSYYTITQVEPAGGEIWPQFAHQRFRAWFRPFDVRGAVSGFSDASQFGPLDFDARGEAIRAVDGTSQLRFESIAEGERLVLHARPRAGDVAPRAWMLRSETADRLYHEGQPVEYDAVTSEYNVVAPAGEAPLWIGWQPVKGSGESLFIHWAGVESGEASAVAARR